MHPDEDELFNPDEEITVDPALEAPINQAFPGVEIEAGTLDDPVKVDEEGDPLPYPLTFCCETEPLGKWLRCEAFGSTTLLVITGRDEEYFARSDVHDRYPIGALVAVPAQAGVVPIEDVDSGMPTRQSFFVHVDQVVGIMTVSGELP